MKDFIVGEAEDVKPQFLQVVCTAAIVFGLFDIEVVLSINFNNELGWQANEVDNVIFDGVLPPKARP